MGPFLAGGLDKFFNILTDRGMYLSPAVGGVEIPQYVRKEDLAEVIGASREVASSLLNQLRKLRLVEYRRKGQRLIRTAALLGDLERLGRARRD